MYRSLQAQENRFTSRCLIIVIAFALLTLAALVIIVLVLAGENPTNKPARSSRTRVRG